MKTIYKHFLKAKILKNSLKFTFYKFTKTNHSLCKNVIKRFISISIFIYHYYILCQALMTNVLWRKTKIVTTVRQYIFQ